MYPMYTAGTLYSCSRACIKYKDYMDTVCVESEQCVILILCNDGVLSMQICGAGQSRFVDG